jgi:hypothetical protein
MLVQTWHPDNHVLRQGVRRANDFPGFRRSIEVNVITGISPAGLRRVFNGLTTRERTELLNEMRQELRALSPRLRRDFYELVGTMERAGLSRSIIDRALPSGFRRSLRPFTLGRRS